MYKINHADIKEWAKNYDGPLFDGILCDPPYELGFMGKSWDSSGIAFDTEMWKDIYKLLKPGAHLLAFSGSRTYHRMAVAIEDAGFEIRDQIIWMYGQGFPKALDISKAIDKMQGNERDKVRHKARPETSGTMSGSSDTRPWIEKSREKGYHEVAGDVPISEQAKLWQGYKTALKPAFEPCVLARKPIEGTVAQNALKYGTGGLAIDKCRVGTETMTEGRAKQAGSLAWQGEDRTGGKGSGFKDTPLDNPQQYTGRFPANLIHDGSDEVVGLFPQTKSGGGNKNSNDTRGSFLGTGFGGIGNKTDWKVDTGSASRFFYCAKSSKSERNAGLEGFEPKREADRVKDDGVGGDNPRNRSNNARQNHHPTVKPLSLTKYLATLIKPPTGGRLLVPFSGSGSEMIGALQAGWEYVEGVELTEEYIPIAEARIKYWLAKVEEETKQLELINVQ